MNHKADLFVDGQCALGEGSIWDSRESVLCWLDIEGRRLFVTDTTAGSTRSFDLGDKAGTVVPRATAGLIVALSHSLVAFDPATSSMETLASFETDAPANRANDGKCDPSGRLWFGSMCPGSEPGTARLYRVDTDLTVTEMLKGVTISNGIVWSHDRKRMYYIDTPTRRIDVFDYDERQGTIAGRRSCIEVPETMGYPDGMTIDDQGCLWVALFGGSRVVCWNPDTGEQLARVDLPVSNVTSCAFGGRNLDELYITTARHLLSKEQLAQQPHAGGLFVARPGAKGVPATAYGG
jgi:sugar lactone lactonase YvrE